MENTIVFTVGALSMVLLAIASLAVYSTVMVLKLKDELRLTHKQFDDVYSTIAAVGGQIERSVDHLQSYVDRRFDKLIDTYLLVKETEKESKKIIKG